jgi:hypothetical protein
MSFGPRLQCLTMQGDLAFLFVASATEKQWGKVEKNLRQVVESFRA